MWIFSHERYAKNHNHQINVSRIQESQSKDTTLSISVMGYIIDLVTKLDPFNVSDVEEQEQR